MRFLLLCCLLLSAPAFANITLSVQSVDGVSSSLISRAGTDVRITGGTAGLACSGVDQYSTCDSCATTTTCTNSAGDSQDFCACNQKRIYDDLVASLTIVGGDGHTLRAQANDAVSGQANTTFNAIDPSGSSVNVRWSDICSHLPTQGSCEGMNQNGTFVIFDDTNEDGILNNGEASLTISVFVFSPMTAGVSTSTAVSDFNVFGQPNAIGLGGFTAIPAQNGVKLGNLLMGSTSLPYGAVVNGLRIFTSDVDMAHASPLFAKATTDLPINNKTTSLGIAHLAPMTQYFFRTALVDQGENLIQFYPDQATLAEQYPQCMISGQVPVTCPFAAIPTN